MLSPKCKGMDIYIFYQLFRRVGWGKRGQYKCSVCLQLCIWAGEGEGFQNSLRLQPFELFVGFLLSIFCVIFLSKKKS